MLVVTFLLVFLYVLTPLQHTQQHLSNCYAYSNRPKKAPSLPRSHTLNSRRHAPLVHPQHPPQPSRSTPRHQSRAGVCRRLILVESPRIQIPRIARRSRSRSWRVPSHVLIGRFSRHFSTCPHAGGTLLSTVLRVSDVRVASISNAHPAGRVVCLALYPRRIRLRGFLLLVV
jgi:hypothetical protein